MSSFLREEPHPQAKEALSVDKMQHRVSKTPLLVTSKRRPVDRKTQLLDRKTLLLDGGSLLLD
jgi:hypothetical protein